MPSLQDRRARLVEVLAEHPNATQVELCDLLLREGHTVTQSTVSRDLQAIGRPRRGPRAVRLGASSPHIPQLGTMPASVRALLSNEVQIVLRTPPGAAPAVGLALDALADPAILGTVAGDDTVLVIPVSIHDLPRLADRLRALLGLPRPPEAPSQPTAVPPRPASATNPVFERPSS